MAFVPRIHNRQQPTANQAVFVRSSLDAQRKHRLAIEQMKPAIDNAWGRTWNGVKDLKQPTYPHVRANLKRAQIQDERFAEIELENSVLLGKLSKILRRPRQTGGSGTRDWTGGLCLNPNQVPNLVCNCVCISPSGTQIVSGWSDGKVP